ncbi:MAG: Mur ligase family protein [Bryobacteraceae bacterium]
MTAPKKFYGFALSALSFVWRRLMFRTAFVAVTGSLGKTTSSRAIAAVLSASYPTNVTREGRNSRPGLAETVLRTRWRHRLTVIEIGTKLPGALRRGSWQLKPDAVVVLNVARCHMDNFRTLEDIAAEKECLLRPLGPRGVAILNGDDPRVRAMAKRCRARVLTFGTSPDCGVWASGISAQWPSRLSFVAHCGDRSHPVQTQFVGEHWVYAALAALAAGLAYDVDLSVAASALAGCEPFTARLQPLPLPSGATILRDDFLPSIDACEQALRVIRTARAQRRILAISDVTDTEQPAEKRYQWIGAAAAESVDFAVFFGEGGETAAGAAVAAGMKPECARSFPSYKEAGEFLRSELREGDLLLLRCDMNDHAERIYWAQFGLVGCSRERCDVIHLCDSCPELRPGLELAVALPPGQRPAWRPR